MDEVHQLEWCHSHNVLKLVAIALYSDRAWQIIAKKYFLCFSSFPSQNRWSVNLFRVEEVDLSIFVIILKELSVLKITDTLIGLETMDSNAANSRIPLTAQDREALEDIFKAVASDEIKQIEETVARYSVVPLESWEEAGWVINSSLPPNETDQA